MTTTPVATAQERFPLLRPLRTSRPFAALWSGQLISRLGDTILYVLLPISVYEMTGSTLAMGLLMTLLLAPQVVMLPFTGVVADRFPRVALMIFADTVRLLLLAALTVLSVLGQLTILDLDVFAFLYSIMIALFNPAYSAVRAQVFTPDIRTAAISLTQISMQGARLLGPAIGGLLVTFVSASYGYAIDALTFVVSIISLASLKLQAPVRDKTSASGMRAYIQDLSGGFQELRKHSWLWVGILVFSVTNVFSNGILSVMVPWLIKIHLSMPAYAYGLMTTSSSAGALLGAYLIGRRSVWHRRGLISYGGCALQSVAFIFLAFTHSLTLLMGLMLLSGIGSMVFSILWEGSMQELVPTEAYGRVASLDMLGSFGLMPVGYSLIGWMATGIGGISTLLISSVVLCAIVFLALLLPSVRRFD